MTYNSRKTSVLVWMDTSYRLVAHSEPASGMRGTDYDFVIEKRSKDALGEDVWIPADFKTRGEEQILAKALFEIGDHWIRSCPPVSSDNPKFVHPCPFARKNRS